MILDDKKFIGRIIRQYRQKNKLTQAQLAEKVDISEKHLGQIERGAFSPTIYTFFKIAQVLEINLTDFGLKYDDEKNEVRKSLIKLIYSISDDELSFYYDVINSIYEYSARLKNSK